MSARWAYLAAFLSVIGGLVSAETLRPLAREVVAPLRPVARVIVPEVLPFVRVSISTMSAPPARSMDAISDLPLFVKAPVQSQVLRFLPPSLPLRGPDDPAYVPPYSEFAAAFAPRPHERPEGITLAALALEAERRRGSVCGDVHIQGVNKGNVPGRGACGIENAVEVRSIAGVRLSSPAVIDCRTATRLRRWVQEAAIPAFAGQGGGLAQIDMMGAYSCRTRNNAAGARLSEHAFGRAVDIGGFRLRDGTRVTVLRGWNSNWGQRLRDLHRAACGPFGTALGPNANAAHRDHFHFDTARYRSGSYCR